MPLNKCAKHALICLFRLDLSFFKGNETHFAVIWSRL